MARATTQEPAPTTAPRDRTAGTSGRAPRKSLPRTASPLPLFELLSGLSIAGGLVLRRSRKAA
jgi:hypothetical protein